MTELHTFTGFLEERPVGHSDNVLFISDNSKPLAQSLAEIGFVRRVPASVRYWVADERASRDALQESAVRTLLGDMDARYVAHYSEYTGYLWTDEEISVGGHDLLTELRSHLGEYCHLEIEVHGQVSA